MKPLKKKIVAFMIQNCAFMYPSATIYHQFWTENIQFRTTEIILSDFYGREHYAQFK